MAKVSKPINPQRGPALSGRLIFDTWRGIMRVRKWPRARGPNAEPWVIEQREWFRDAARASTRIDAEAMRILKEATHRTPFYWRDIAMSLMSGRQFILTDTNGRHWYPVTLIRTVSEWTDVLAHEPGSILFRDADRWVGLAPGSPGQLLTTQGPDDPPIWASGAGGGAWTLRQQITIPADMALGAYVDLDAIPQSWLQLMVTVDAPPPPTGLNIAMRFNADDANHYTRQPIGGALAGGFQQTAQLIAIFSSGDMQNTDSSYRYLIRRDEVNEALRIEQNVTSSGAGAAHYLSSYKPGTLGPINTINVASPFGNGLNENTLIRLYSQ